MLQLLLDALEVFVVVVVAVSDEPPASEEASVVDEQDGADDAAAEDETVEFAARSRPPVFCCCSRCSLRVLIEIQVSIEEVRLDCRNVSPGRHARCERIDDTLRLVLVALLRIARAARPLSRLA